MALSIRTWLGTYQEVLHEGGPSPEEPLRKAAAVVVLRNPYAGRYSADLDELIGPSGALATELVERAKALLGVEAHSCGKGAVVGVDGEQEHGVALLTSPFGDAMRSGIGGSTWVTSTTKVGGPGTTIDVPLAHKNALMVRAFYDAMTVTLHDAPRPGEIAIVAALGSRGRIHERVGGLRVEEATVGDGLR